MALLPHVFLWYLYTMSSTVVPDLDDDFSVPAPRQNCPNYGRSQGDEVSHQLESLTLLIITVRLGMFFSQSLTLEKCPGFSGQLYLFPVWIWSSWEIGAFPGTLGISYFYNKRISLVSLLTADRFCLLKIKVFVGVEVCTGSYSSRKSFSIFFF